MDNWNNDERFQPNPQNYQQSEFVNPQADFSQQNNDMYGQPYIDPYQNLNQVTMSDEELNKKANKLCLWSTLLMVVPRVIYYVIILIVGISTGTLSGESITSSGLYDSFSSSGYSIFSSLMSLFSLAMSGCGIASFVLMIIVRVKYPKNTWGKVLMWIYIIGAILAVIAVIALVVACVSCASSFPG